MNKSVFSFAILFVVLVLVQALILNHIVLFNCAICFIFIYFLIRLPNSVKTNALMSLAFLLGLSVDMLSDTPGLNALACTVLAVMKRPVFFAYEQHDDQKRNISPSIATMGILNYVKFLITMSAIYCLITFFVEFMYFADIIDILIRTGASSVFTFLVILAIDSMIPKNTF